MNTTPRSETLASNPHIELKNQWITQNVDNFIEHIEKTVLDPSQGINRKILALLNLAILNTIGVSSDSLSSSQMISEIISLGKTFCRNLPDIWHEEMLLVLNVAFIDGNEERVSEFSDSLEVSSFQRSADSQLRAVMPVLFQIANLCRTNPQMDLDELFSSCAKCRTKPDSSLQKAVAALAQGNQSEMQSVLIKSATRASAKINSDLKKGRSMTPYDQQLLSHALIWNCAVYKGMDLVLPASLYPFMITRQSLRMPRPTSTPRR